MATWRFFTGSRSSSGKRLPRAPCPRSGRGQHRREPSPQPPCPRSGNRRPTIRGGEVTQNENSGWHRPSPRRRGPRPPLRPKRSALRAPQGYAPAKAHDEVQPQHQLQPEQKANTMTDQKQENQNSKKGTLLIG